MVSVSTGWLIHTFLTSAHREHLTRDTQKHEGCAGLLAVLGAVKRNTQIDLYGFNWSSKSYQLHQMSEEELVVQAVAKQFPNLVIHPTACNALYSCDSLCDTSQFRLAVDQQNCKAQVRHLSDRAAPLAYSSLGHQAACVCALHFQQRLPGPTQVWLELDKCCWRMTLSGALNDGQEMRVRTGQWLQRGNRCRGSHSPACCLQLEKSRHGAKVRFIDHHTLHNLDWYPDIKEELKDPKVKEELNITLPQPRSQKHHEAWQAGMRAGTNKQGGIPILHRCFSPPPWVYSC